MTRHALRSARALALLVLLGWSLPALANGVGVVDASAGTYVRLTRSSVEVDVEGQVALVTATHTFVNPFASPVDVTYAFPLPEGASATGLRWLIDGEWHDAVFVASPQGGLPGTGTVDANLRAYLDGGVPLIFPIGDPLAPAAPLVVEVSYVQLLPYAFGDVLFATPNDYGLIQAAALAEQRFAFSLTSARTIESVAVLSHGTAETTNDGTTATAAWVATDAAADEDYRVRYTLSAQELGLFGFSTLLPDSSVADEGPPGFLLFVAEPDPGGLTEAIDKVFTLIVDRSGSMLGTKIVQARNAARFIVEHLNEGDLFNIVDFGTDVRSFRTDHVPYTPANRDAALTYINSLAATGSTNISGAFDVAVPQFDSASDSTANLIVFFTDGQATAGITQTQALLAHVRDLVAQTETGVLLFTFGIGTDVNRQLLTLLASENDGLSAFLDNDEVEARITEFYLQIRNPVLLNAQIAFDPAVVSAVFPDPAPSLFKGSQMIVAGRYTEPVPVTVTLSGTAFGQPVSYAYQLPLADSSEARYQFLTKVWAKLAIEDLLVAYYSQPTGSPQAEAIRQQIIALSLQFGVMSPFTSLGTGEPPPTEGEEGPAEEAPALLADLGPAPNPFTASTTLRFRAGAGTASQVVQVRIYNLLGQLLQVLTVRVDGAGTYEVVWDGRTSGGDEVPSGTYVYVIESDRAVLAGRLTVVR